MRDADEVGAFVDGILRRIVDPPREVTRAEKLAEARARARAREEARSASERRAKETAAVPETPPTPEHPSRALDASARDERWWTSVDASARGISADDPSPSTSTSSTDPRTRAPTARRDERHRHKTVAAATTTTRSSSAARGKPGWRGGGTPVSARELARRAADAAAAPPRKPRAPAPDEESLPWPPPRRAPSSNPPLPARRRPEPSRNHRSRNDAENIDPAGVRTRPRAFDDGIDVDRRPGTSRLARTVAASTRRASAAAATGVPKTIAEARCETCGARNVCAAVDATRPFQRGAAPPLRERIGEGARRKTVTRTATPAAKTLAPCARCGRAWYCGAACAAADWETHRRACAGTSRGYGPPGRIAETSLRGEREGSDASLRFMTTSIARGS